MNLSEIARKLKVTPDDLRNALPTMGFDIGKRAIKVPDHQVDRIIQAYQALRRKRQMEEEERIFQEMRAKRLAETGGADKPMVIPDKLTVRQLSDALGLPVAKVMSELMRNGIMATINQTIDYDTASIIAGDLGYAVERETAAVVQQGEEAAMRKRLETLLSDNMEDEDMTPRPPVVVVMGHVDHGKTSLLDAIRKTTVAAGESGGITQHIGAYQVEVKTTEHPDGRKITFLDTPGHQAFSNMRSRGGRVADIAVLVVAADDGIQPQTIESLEIIQREGMPFVVAINKIDKPDADVNRVKQALTELNVIPEDYGGNAVIAPLSAKTGEGMPALMDMILLLADMKKITANAKCPAVGTIIESHVNKDEGVTATVIIQAGTLENGALVVAGAIPGRVRVMKDYRGHALEKATPGMPVQVFGLKDAPAVGDVLQVVEDKKVIKELQKKWELEKLKQQAVSSETKATEMNVILVADVSGTLEALESALEGVQLGKGRVKVVKTSVGSLNEANVLEAVALKAAILAFKVDIKPAVEILAKEKGVFAKRYDVIYDLIDDANAKLREIVQPEMIRKDIGKAKVLKIFRRGPKDMIVGVAVTEGLVRPSTKGAVTRNGVFVTRVAIDGVQMGKEAVGEMSKGAECGLKLLGDPIVEEGDYIDVYAEELEKL